MIPGIAERLKAELAPKAPLDTELSVLALEGRAHAAWMGGSILGSLGAMQQVWSAGATGKSPHSVLTKSLAGFTTHVDSASKRPGPAPQLANLNSDTCSSLSLSVSHTSFGLSCLLLSQALASARPQMWITKAEYDENGPLIVNRKCF